MSNCPNGHNANSNGNCFASGCTYSNSNRHQDVARGKTPANPPNVRVFTRRTR